ncbi:MAG: T9SS type A sorting domain-containing protein [Chitinivibrionales bacterium]
MKLDNSGKVVLNKLFKYKYYQYAQSINIAQNGDFLVGGYRYGAPLIFQTDTAGNIKWSTWYYDSVGNNLRLQKNAAINSLRETSRGTIICAAGDPYPNNNGQVLNNYAAMLEFDSLGNMHHYREFNNVTGYNIGGFYVDETQGKNFVLSGNQGVLYTDTVDYVLWQKNYTFMLTGVGSETNNISRAKVLRDNNLIVAGQAYEGNCWTTYKHLYYDAWWSSADYGSGSNRDWDTAGKQGADDDIDDFTQLNNGNLVFVGEKGGANGNSPLWVFVTDSTGKRLLWEKQFLNKSTKNVTMYPMSVAASPDGGFTVVGYGNFGTDANDAFAQHFVYKPVSAVMYRGNFQAKSLNGFSVRLAGAKLVVSGKTPGMVMSEVSLFDVSGRCVATQAVGAKGSSPLSFDISKLAHGTYVVRLKAGSAVETTKFAY